MIKNRFIISNIINKLSEKYPDREAFIFPDEDITYSYREFNDEVETAAKALIAKGIKKGDKIGLWMDNISNWFIMFFAIIKIGAIAVPINTDFKEKELQHILSINDVRMLFMTSGNKHANYNKIIENVIPNVPGLSDIITIGYDSKYESFDDFINGGIGVSKREVSAREENVYITDPCVILPTSGTTGFPKGVILSNIALIKNGYSIGERLALDVNDNMLIQVPMFHCFGLTLSLLSSLTHMSKITVIGHFNPIKSLRAIENKKVTVVNGVPTMFEMMMNCESFSDFDVSSVKKGIMAGSNCYPKTIKEAEEKFGMIIVQTYGLTEASPGLTMSSVSDSENVRHHSVGNALPGVTCRIVKSNGEEAQIDEEGEIVMKGYNQTTGYYHMPKETIKLIDSEGWLHTGDVGTKDEFGFYHITDRIKDIIIRGGENISPKEVEIYLMECPGVLSAVVFGIPDPVMGQRVGAHVKTDGSVSVDDILKYMSDICARCKIPEIIKIVDEFPLNANGKVVRGDIAKQYEKRQ